MRDRLTMPRHGDAGRVRLLAMDVDGVLTDGGLYMGQDIELKRFCVQDGLGLRLAALAGIALAWISGRESVAVRGRAAELGDIQLFEGVQDKRLVVERLAHSLNLDFEDIGFIGDDLNDLPVMRCCGWACAPSNAAPMVRLEAHYVCDAAGGHGAVREACEVILGAQRTLDRAINDYLTMYRAEPFTAM